ncbi:MAG: NADH-quinone oxidoreductase subunit C, partial [Myxococcales bacterium]
MTPEEIQQVLAAKFGESVGALQPAKQDPWVLVKPEAIVEVCRFLKDDPRTRMDSLMNLTAVDWPKRNNIDVV